jgi:hypothetical protein
VGAWGNAMGGPGAGAGWVLRFDGGGPGGGWENGI